MGVQGLLVNWVRNSDLEQRTSSSGEVGFAGETRLKCWQRELTPPELHDLTAAVLIWTSGAWASADSRYVSWRLGVVKEVMEGLGFRK